MVIEFCPLCGEPATGERYQYDAEHVELQSASTRKFWHLTPDGVRHNWTKRRRNRIPSEPISEDATVFGVKIRDMTRDEPLRVIGFLDHENTRTTKTRDARR